MEIKKGSRFKIDGSDSVVEVLEDPTAVVRYQVVEPVASPHVSEMTIDEFKKVALDPATGLTEAATLAKEQQDHNASQVQAKVDAELEAKQAADRASAASTGVDLTEAQNQADKEEHSKRRSRHSGD